MVSEGHSPYRLSIAFKTFDTEENDKFPARRIQVFGSCVSDDGKGIGKNRVMI